jgi:hypothetical protein
LHQLILTIHSVVITVGIIGTIRTLLLSILTTHGIHHIIRGETMDSTVGTAGTLGIIQGGIMVGITDLQILPVSMLIILLVYLSAVAEHFVQIIILEEEEILQF